ncbi:SCO family protein [Psychroserpens ponticola]|uniref:SCO family protein n=1 Tax=Psychroserpens ponticola TaxID=2932268 RepID=A0ABY7RV20_9FLAO|nr:SCO family protein [Psychroserpens ponticola]WCO00617.1 SCO family protein [Psychroserpens ponticola]
MKAKKTFLFSFLCLAFLGLFSCNNRKNNVLPIYNPTDFKSELVDKNLRNKSKNHTVSDFELINQNGQIITQDIYKDKIYVADFFFTTCGTICPIMTNNMRKIQEEFINDNDIMLLSLSVLPETDNVAVLKEYAKTKGVINGKWNVTTGDKKHIYELARQSYFAVVKQGDRQQDFIHTPNFILIDKEKQIRGIYDGTKDEDIKRIIEDIHILKN